MREKEEHITRVSVEGSRKLKGKTDFARLDALDDEDIARAVAIDPEEFRSTQTGRERA